jgi:hypothetical protein
MLWVDTSTTPPTIRQRSADNLSWVQVAQLTASWGLNNAATITNTLNQLVATGTTPAIEDRFSTNGWFNVKSYGAKGDGVFLYDAVVSGTAITCATTAPFVGRAGQTILIPGAKSANLTNSTATGTTTLFQARGNVRLSVTNRISFANPGTISDSGNGLASAGFGAGETLFVADGSGGGNNGIYTILSVDAGGGFMTVGAVLNTTLASVTNSSHAVLTTAADNAITMASGTTATTPVLGTDDHTAIQGAIDAAQGSGHLGGGVLAPRGIYLTSAGFSWSSAPVRFVGQGGIGEHGSAKPPQSRIGAATIFVCAADDPVFLITAADKSLDYPAMWSSVEHLAILGYAAQGTSYPTTQMGVTVDSRGINLKNVSAFGLGGHGFKIVDCVDGLIQLCAANYNYGDGFHLNPQEGSGGTTYSDVTSTVFLGCTALGNYSNGGRFDGGTVNCRWIGGSVERNGEYGFLFDQSAGGFEITADNSVWGVHEETNSLGSVNFRNATALVKKNEVHGRWSTAPIFGLSYQGNTVSGIITTDAVPHPRTQIRKLLSAGGKDSGDTDHLSIRNQNDTSDTIIQVNRVVITRAVTDSPDGLNASAPVLISGNGSPETVITARIGSIYMRLDGGANTSMYVKESGTGNTGWIGK